MPISPLECLIINNKLEDHFDVDAEDVKILTHLYSKIYPHIVNLYPIEFYKLCNQFLDFSNNYNKIKDGEFVIIPVGFSNRNFAHSSAIVFYNNEFIICNRGCRFTEDTPVIQRFRYDYSNINLDVLKYLIVKSKIEFVDKIEHGAANQYLQYEVILPKILNATRINEAESTNPSFKYQRAENCTKASPLRAVKIGIYLKLIKNGKSNKEAQIIAKKAGDVISIKLRQKSIDKAKILLKSSELDDDMKIKLSRSIKRAERKLQFKRIKKDPV